MGKQLDTQKLVKLLNQSTSDFDGEALTAIRMANGMLRAAGVLWNNVIKAQGEALAPRPAQSGTRVDPTPRRQSPNASGDDLEHMLDELANEVHGKGLDFVESVRSFLRQRGYITAKQREAVEKFYDQVFGG